jgi:hypothetical protein
MIKVKELGLSLTSYATPTGNGGCLVIFQAQQGPPPETGGCCGGGGGASIPGFFFNFPFGGGGIDPFEIVPANLMVNLRETFEALEAQPEQLSAADTLADINLLEERLTATLDRLRARKAELLRQKAS